MSGFFKPVLFLLHCPVEIYPSAGYIHFNRGNVLTELKRFQEAEKSYDLGKFHSNRRPCFAFCDIGGTDFLVEFSHLLFVLLMSSFGVSTK